MSDEYLTIHCPMCGVATTPDGIFDPCRSHRPAAVQTPAPAPAEADHGNNQED